MGKSWKIYRTPTEVTLATPLNPTPPNWELCRNCFKKGAIFSPNDSYVTHIYPKFHRKSTADVLIGIPSCHLTVGHGFIFMYINISYNNHICLIGKSSTHGITWAIFHGQRVPVLSRTAARAAPAAQWEATQAGRLSTLGPRVGRGRRRSTRAAWNGPDNAALVPIWWAWRSGKSPWLPWLIGKSFGNSSKFEPFSITMLVCCRVIPSAVHVKYPHG